MEKGGRNNPFARIWKNRGKTEIGRETVGSAEEAELSRGREQKMAKRGRALSAIAGKLRYGFIYAEKYVPGGAPEIETSHEQYMGRDYSAEVLASDDIADSAKATYMDIVRDHPRLKAVKICSGKDVDGGFGYWSSDNGGETHRMIVYGDYSEGSPEGNMAESEYFSKIVTANRLAIELGCDAVDIMSHATLQRDLLLLHEMGHADSFITRYLEPSWRDAKRQLSDSLEGGSGDDAFSAALSEAAEEWERRTITSGNTSGLMPQSLVPLNEATRGMSRREAEKYKESLIGRFKMRFAANGAHDLEDVSVEEARSYRRQEEEAIADDFAYDYVMSHLDKYFLAPGEEPDGSGRIARGIYREIDVSDTFHVDLNCCGGNYIMLKSRETGEVGDGRLVRTPHVNEELLLTSSDDPDDTEDVRSYGLVKTVTCKMFVGKDGERHRLLRMKTDRGEYIMSTPREVHRPMKRSAEEMREALHVEKGQELQLMGLLATGDSDDYIDESGKYSDALSSGELIYGKIMKEIEEGRPIDLAALTIRGKLMGWRSWPVESIEQDWHHWRINTRLGDKTASYEVLPLPKKTSRIDRLKKTLMVK